MVAQPVAGSAPATQVPVPMTRDQLNAQLVAQQNAMPAGPTPMAATAPPPTVPNLIPGAAGGQFSMSPQQAAIVKLGILSRAAKMGDVATPLEQAFYNSPY